MNDQLTSISSSRISSIDFTRGLVIVIMALDHIRDLLHTQGVNGDPLDLQTTTPGLFMTRFVTHFCAPVFVFLSGSSAFLLMKKQQQPQMTRRFLATRGLWLMLLELTVVTFGIWADLKFRTFLLQVIFAIGAGFVALSQLSRLPSRVVGYGGLAILLFHNALPQLSFPDNHAAGFTWSLLFQRGFFPLSPERGILIGYALVPWLGVMMLGYSFGELFTLEAAFRKRVLLFSGCAALVLFAVLRGFNLYGDPSPWTAQTSGLFTFLSFINVTKYPPSLLYLAITLGPMFFLLACSEQVKGPFGRFLITFGRVPLFFYLLHWYLVHASMFVIILLQGVSWQQMPFGLMKFGRPADGVGLPLWGIYVYWILLILSTYPLCRWYGKYKRTHSERKWLAYL